MIRTKKWQGGTDEEYETQHFGFGSQRLQIALRDMVEQNITTCVKNIESDLQESLELNDTDKVTLTRSCDNLVRLYCERAEPSLIAIDSEIKKMLSVPANTLLPGNEVQLQQMSDEDYEKLKEEVTGLRKRVERGALMEALLSAEEQELASAEKICEMAKMDMDALDLVHKCINEGDKVKSIQDETQFLCASVKHTNDLEVLNISM